MMDEPGLDRHSRVGLAMNLLLEGLRPFVKREIGVDRLDLDERLAEFQLGKNAAHLRQKSFLEWDVPNLLNLMDFTWSSVFRGALERTAQGHVKELQDVRVAWARQKSFSEDQTNRALDTTILFLHAIGANGQAEKVEQVLAELTPASSPKLINARDRKDTSLHLEALNSNAAFVEALIAGGADLEARNENGRTPLHVAALNSNPAVVEALIAGGADPNARDKAGDTPLHVAAQSNYNPAVVEALIAGGAPAAPSAGWSALDSKPTTRTPPSSSCG